MQVITTGATPGSIFFADSSSHVAQDNTNLFWDAALHILKVAGELDFQSTDALIKAGGTTVLDTSGGVLNFKSATTMQIQIGGLNLIDYAVGHAGRMTIGAPLEIGTGTPQSAPPAGIYIAQYQSSGSTGPTFVFDTFTTAGVLGFGQATTTSNDCRFWFGQASDFGQAWDLSTAAGHLGHLEVFNGSLGVGSAGTVDAYISRASSGVIAFGTTTTNGDASATIKAKTKAGAPTTSDVTAGSWALIRDTTNSTTKLYYNNAGTLQSVALA